MQMQPPLEASRTAGRHVFVFTCRPLALGLRGAARSGAPSCSRLRPICVPGREGGERGRGLADGASHPWLWLVCAGTTGADRFPTLQMTTLNCCLRSSQGKNWPPSNLTLPAAR